MLTEFGTLFNVVILQFLFIYSFFLNSIGIKHVNEIPNKIQDESMPDFSKNANLYP